MLLGEPTSRGEEPRLEPGWFVSNCPLDPEDALEALRKRHGFASRTALLRALQEAREELRAASHPDAKALDDLADEARRR